MAASWGKLPQTRQANGWNANRLKARLWTLLAGGWLAPPTLHSLLPFGISIAFLKFGLGWIQGLIMGNQLEWCAGQWMFCSLDVAPGEARPSCFSSRIWEKNPTYCFLVLVCRQCSISLVARLIYFIFIHFFGYFSISFPHCKNSHSNL